MVDDYVYIVMCYERYEGSQLLGIAKTVESGRNIIRQKLKEDIMLNQYYWINTDTEIQGMYFDDDYWIAERFISIERWKVD